VRTAAHAHRRPCAPPPVRALPVRATPVRAVAAVGAERIVAEADGTMLPIVDTSSAPAGTERRNSRKVH